MKLNIINLSKKTILIFTLICLKLLFTKQTVAQTTTIQVHNLTSPNPVGKAGYNLIWSDEFPGTSLSPTFWNKSTTNDDGTVSCERDLTMNPANVTVAGGLAKLTINSNDFDGCTGSCSEIKTFSINDASFIDYYFNDPCYIEIRVKNLPFKTGLGSAAWVYNCDAPEYSEIDLWETDGESEDRFTTTYHWQEGDYVPGCTLEGTETRRKDSKIIKVKNLDDPAIFGFHDLDLSVEWLIYGIEWDGSTIKWYLNNVLARTIDLNNTPPEGSSYHKPYGQLTLRIGTGNNSVGDSVNYSVTDLPVTMNIDYVRAYVKSGFTACGINRSPTDICLGTGDIIKTNYLPGVTYTWTSTGFDFGTTDINIPSERWITPKTGVAVNQYYSAILTATFPSGYTETSSTQIFLSSGVPSKPTKVVTAEQINALCEYTATYKKDNMSQNVLWSKTGSAPWTEGTNYETGGFYYSKFYGDYLPSHSYSVKVKVTNDCGTSIVSDWRNFTTPAPPEGCWWKVDNDAVDTASLYSSNSIINCTPSITYTYSKLNIFLDDNSCQNENYFLLIYNILGQMIDLIEINESTEIEIPSESSGVYIAILKTQSGVIVSTNKFYK
ncbi:MAG TPA: family 16 glycosylhydrolase [Chitinophagales bacterium]|nr:family 16 glycosylhydrolase [Chitinophagales bacterium]HRG87250.1 family 16 glycosylhydrolase [Chitinophagales bacterium]